MKAKHGTGEHPRPQSLFYSTFDTDKVGANGIDFDEDWKTQGTSNSPFHNSVNRVQISLPLGMDFPLYLVVGHDSEGNAHFWITLSSFIMNELRSFLVQSIVHEIHNSELWRRSGNNQKTCHCCHLAAPRRSSSAV